MSHNGRADKYSTPCCRNSDKRKQLMKMKFLVNEPNVSVMYIDINAISLYFDLNIFQQDECFCSKLGMDIEYPKSNLKTSLSQIWVICQLLPFVRVGQSGAPSSIGSLTLQLRYYVIWCMFQFSLAEKRSWDILIRSHMNGCMDNAFDLPTSN